MLCSNLERKLKNGKRQQNATSNAYAGKGRKINQPDKQGGEQKKTAIPRSGKIDNRGRGEGVGEIITV
jgi:hypothetical protein